MTEGGVQQDKSGQTLTKQHLKKTDSKQSTDSSIGRRRQRERVRKENYSSQDEKGHPRTMNTTAET